jgi:pyruvate carboxylase subunit B
MENRRELSNLKSSYTERLEMKYLITIGSKKFAVSLDGDQSHPKIDGRDVQVNSRRLRAGKLYSILVDNINYEISLERSNGGFDIWHGSELIHADVSDEKSERFKSLMGGAASGVLAGSLKAPMPGLVVKVEVEAGQHVKKGDGLVIVEAMKMENELKAHASAIIKEIKVKPGQSIDKNQVLILFE